MLDSDLEFERHRTHLRALAYRMTGSLVEADDVLQDAYIKWRARMNSQECAYEVNVPRAYLSTLVTRLCIDWLESARIRRETYVGPWLPEPVLDTEGVRPDVETELARDVTVALLLALERLSPLERAAFLLHDVFDVDYGQVASTLGRSESACRQLTARARAAVRADKQRHHPSEADAQRVLMAFASAAAGDMQPLQQVLAHDVVYYSDGGGKVSAATRPIVGRERVIKFISALVTKFSLGRDFRVDAKRINGMPGFVVTAPNHHVDQTLAFELADGLLTRIYAVRNPDKLSRLDGAISQH